MPHPHAEIEQASSTLETALRAVHHPQERSTVQRAVAEAARVHVGDIADVWSRWVAEGAKSLGASPRVLDCTAGEVVDLLRSGAVMLLWQPGDLGWIAAQRQGRKYCEIQATGTVHQTLRYSVFERQLTVATPPGKLVRVVVLEEGIWSEGGPATGVGRGPISQYLLLLRAERGDIGVVVIFALVSGLLMMATPLAVEALVNTVSFGQFVQPVVVLSLMLLAFLTFSASLRALQTFVVEIIQRRLYVRVAADIAYRLPRATTESLDGRDASELVNRFFDVVTLQKVTAQLLLDGVSLVMGTLIGMSILGFYHPWLLGFDIVLLLLIAFVIFVLGRGAVYTSIKESKAKYHMAAWLENLAACPLAFRQAGAADFARDRADRLAYDYLVARKKHFVILMRQVVFALALQAVASTVLLGLGGWLVILGQLSLGQLVAAELIVAVIVGAFAKLGKHMESYYDVLAAIDKLSALMSLPVEPSHGMLFDNLRGPLSVDMNHVEYVGGLSGGLASFELSLQPAEHCALTGPHDHAQGLVCDLLFALRNPTHGHLQLGGQDVRELRLDILRQHVALVRGIETFEGTLAECIHLQRPNVSATDARWALELVGLFAETQELPDGLETQLGSRGWPFSRKQVHQLMLARAVAGRPGLLLIDGTLDPLPDQEATEILQRLIALDQPWTLILVTSKACLIQALPRQVPVLESPRIVSTAPGAEAHHGH